MEQAVLTYLRKEPDERVFQSLTTLFEKVQKPSDLQDDGFDLDDDIDTKMELQGVLSAMVEDGILESHWGERDYEASYRLTSEGIYQASGFDSHLVVGGSDGVPHKVPIRDSTNWTGPSHILVDSRVLQNARQTAQGLRELVYAYHTTDNALSSDLKTLVDALLQLLEMCEPELGPIERILASPKFRVSAALLAAVATVRGALGI